MAWIYRIVRIADEACYVGHTSQKPRIRFAAHLALLKQAKHHSIYLQNAWSKHSAAAFRFEILEECEEASKVQREQHWIDNLDSRFNYGKVAGTAFGQKRTAEQRGRMSLAALGNQKTKELVWSDEARANLSRARTNVPQTEAQKVATLRALELGRQKSAANKPGWVPSHRIGAKDSAATIEKRRISRLAFEAGQRDKGIGNWWITDGATEQMIPSTDPIPSGWRRGRQPKIGEIGRSRVGEKRSDAARAKMSAAHLKRDALALDAGS